jgi:MerR family transcriptional regulator/heat shock protein HspR
MQLDPYDPIYTISVVSRLLDLHEQTIRQYERLGFVCPCRSLRKTRMYSQADVSQLECINYLVKTCGVNLAGVRILVQLSNCDPKVAEQIHNRNFNLSDESHS